MPRLRFILLCCNNALAAVSYLTVTPEETANFGLDREHSTRRLRRTPLLCWVKGQTVVKGQARQRNLGKPGPYTADAAPNQSTRA